MSVFLCISFSAFVTFVGVVALTDELSSIFEDETDENRVHLLVHNIVPPFLDGRIVFTRVSATVTDQIDFTSIRFLFTVGR